MTGFARTEGHDPRCTWIWEVRSVNGKGLDIRCRVPLGFERLELNVRERIQNTFRRGNVSANLSISWIQASGGYRVNEEVLDSILSVLPKLTEKVPSATTPGLDGLLGLKGVIEARDDALEEEERDRLEAQLLGGLDKSLEALENMRTGEGDKLHQVLRQQIDGIEDLCEAAVRLAEVQPEKIRQRLKKQIESLLEEIPALPEERLAQEAALLMTKADIAEELDRLSAHVEAARKLLGQGGAIGRKLDFLCQEFNREANTLCSKSSDVELTRIGLDLKARIEQFREQVQNIE